MKVAIHQPHYFPWMGYFDKMAKVDKFIIMDDVQLEDSSVMVRNKFLENTWVEKILSLNVDKKGYLEKKCREINLKDWQKVRKKHSKFLYYNYKNAPYFNEIWEKISCIFEKNYELLIELQMDIIMIFIELLNIKTEIVFQSSLKYDIETKKNDLVLELCQKIEADVYLSGNGAKKYMDDSTFLKNNIKVIYQKFKYPEYKQFSSLEFIPNLSILDMFFNLGIIESNKVFWKNVEEGREIEDRSIWYQNKRIIKK